MIGPDYHTEFVTHVDTGTKAQVRRPVSRIVDKWLDESGPLFPSGARQAIQHCERLWEACPTLGRLTASYEPRSAGGGVSFEDRFASDARRELALIEGWFPADHWRVFEVIVRDGRTAGEAGANLERQRPAAIMAAKALVGSIAAQIAVRKGWH